LYYYYSQVSIFFKIQEQFMQVFGTILSGKAALYKIAKRFYLDVDK